MDERIYGVSYRFSDQPHAQDVAKQGSILYNPAVVYYCEKDDKCIDKRFPNQFKATLYGNMNSYSIDNKNNFKNLKSHARANQERLISDYICAIVLHELRLYPNADLIFFIKDDFETSKVIGRLGYLGLPLNRVHIMFISQNITDLLSNYINPFAEIPKSDLSLLFKTENRKKILGPYPDDDVVTMLRSFFCTYENEELYPIRINLFSQFMNKSIINSHLEKMEKMFFSENWTELSDVIGGSGYEKTRIPTVLAQCEDRLKYLSEE